MTVRVNKPEFNLREKLSELERPIGLKGSELMRAETTQEAGTLLGVGRRNFCINGNFKCWQRATSIASSATGNNSNSYKYVSADRWQSYFYNTYDRQDVVLPNGEKVYALRETMQTTRNFLVYIIENGGRTWNQGGDITISFWARTSGSRTGVSLGYYWHDNWAGSAYTNNNERKNIIIEGSEWKHYSVTKRLNANANNRANLAIEFDNINYVGSWIQLTSGEWWEFANVQIEKGKVASEFEHRSYGEELALCQRYYARVRMNQQEWLYNESNTASHKWHWTNVPFSMRSNPSVDVSDLSTGISVSGLSGTISSVAAQQPGDTPGRVSTRITMSQNTGTARYIHHFDGWSGDYMAFSSEL